jgi:hypothetical protein
VVPGVAHGEARHLARAGLNSKGRRAAVSPEQATFERHYRIGDLAEMWKLGRETVRLLVKDEQGVIKIRLGRKKAHTIYSVPESVAVRIHTRLLNSR